MARPTGVTVLAVLGFICGAFMLLASLGMFLMGSAGMLAASRQGGALGGPLAIFGAFAGVAFLIFAALYVVCGVGLLKLANWARILTIVLVALGLVFSAFGAFGAMVAFHMGSAIFDLVILAIDAWILLYLFKPHVKQAFGTA
jgi:hypothetical protein